MKKQGDFYLKLTSILMAVFLAAYLICSLVVGRSDSYSLETAVYCEVGDGIPVSGFVVRSEEVLVSDLPILVRELAEGQRVGGGQVVAAGYFSGEDKTRREELLSLLRQKDELTQVLGGSDAANASVLEEQIAAQIVSIAIQTERRNFDSMHRGAAALEPLILRRCVSASDTEQISARLASIDGRIAALQAQTDAGRTGIPAPEAGYFSAVTDGYEALLTPSVLGQMTLSQLHALQEQTVSAPSNAVGRLITGQTWYYLTEVPYDRFCTYQQGDRLDVSFTGDSLQVLRMTIDRIGPQEGSSCLLVLSCDRRLQDVTALRRQNADILFGNYAGLSVPKEALYVLDGETGVYVLEGARADWKPVEILCEHGEDYLVKWDSSDTDYLWPKDELILTAEELTDGKVIGE